MDKIILFIKEFKLVILLTCLGVLILGYGVYVMLGMTEARVEIIRENDSNNSQITQDLKVDVAGAVIAPGVYSLSSGSRIGDAIVRAGGLGDTADNVWIAKSLNLAEEVKDGQKIYIPEKSIEKPRLGDGRVVSSTTNLELGKVNINTASLAELDSLTGIGEVRAKTILDNRPYAKIDDLVNRAEIPESVYEKIKDKVSVY